MAGRQQPDLAGLLIAKRRWLCLHACRSRAVSALARVFRGLSSAAFWDISGAIPVFCLTCHLLAA